MMRIQLTPRVYTPSGEFGARVIARALMAVGLAIGLAASRRASGTTYSRWSKASDWGNTAVHLMISPSSNSLYHSQVLWWRGENQDGPYGQLQYWKVASESNTDAFPAANFAHVDSLPVPHRNEFCTGHTHLGDGRILVVGGTAEGDGELGTNSSLLFDPASAQWDSTHSSSMAHERWYPSAVELGDGRAVIASGSYASQNELFGGRNSLSAAPTDSSILRATATIEGEFEPSIAPSSPTSASHWPKARWGQAATYSEFFISPIFFGGNLSSADNSVLTNDLYSCFRQPNALETGYTYSWFRYGATENLVNSSIIPTARTQATVFPMANGGFDDIVVVGGRDGSSALDEVWCFGTKTNGTYNHQWVQASGAAPFATYGAAAAADTYHDVAYVFGGSATPGSLPVSNKLWKLEYAPVPWTSTTLPSAPSMSWTALTPIGDPGPRPRRGAAMVMDTTETQYDDPFYYPTHHAKRLIVFGGVDDLGAYSDSLWILWIKPDTTWWQRLRPRGIVSKGRENPGYSWDPVLQRLYLYGGQRAFSSGSVRALKDCGFIGLTDAWKSIAPDTLAPELQWNATDPLPDSTTELTAVYRPRFTFTPETEVFDPLTSGGSGGFTTVGSYMNEKWFPFMFTIPHKMVKSVCTTDTSARIFCAGSDLKSHWFSPLNGWTDPSVFSSNPGGSAVMYRVGKILKTGSRDQDGSNRVPISWHAEIIDLTGSGAPSWAMTDSMVVPRVNANLVLLPTGDVLAVGGLTQYGNFTANGSPASYPEIWSPNTGLWSGGSGSSAPLAEQKLVRGYHSSAILLPDGRVLSASGNPSSPGIALGQPHRLDYDSVNVFTPPYLFDGSGNLATRPQLLTCDSIGVYGGTLHLTTDSSGVSVVLLRPGSATHGFNPEQRYIPLTNIGGIGWYIPSEGDSLPPGDYYVFALKNNVPSIARWIRIGDTPPTDVDDLVTDCPLASLLSVRWSAPVGESSVPWSSSAEYELRVREGAAVNVSDLTTSERVTTGVPASPGALEFAIVASYAGASPISGHHYYFRIRSKNASGLWSGWSASLNVLARTNVDCDPSLAGGGDGSSGFRAQKAIAGRTSQVQTANNNTMFDGQPVMRASTDRLVLSSAPTSVDGHSRLWLNQAGEWMTHVSDVALVAVDHMSSSRVVAMDSSYVAGSLIRASSATLLRADGSRITEDLSKKLSGSEGDTLLVELAPGGEASGTPIMVTGSSSYDVWGDDSTGVLFQVSDSSKVWHSLGRRGLRHRAADIAVRSTGGRSVRLIFLSSCVIEAIGHVTASETAPTVTRYLPVAAAHSDSGDVLVRLHQEGVDIGGGQSLAALFDPSQTPTGSERSWVFELSGWRVGRSNTSQLSRGGLVPGEAVVFGLGQNRPNPFAHSTLIRMGIPNKTAVKLEVFDLLGRRIRVLANAQYEPGYYSVEWDGRSEGGVRSSPGVYMYRLSAGGRQATRRLVMLP